MAMIVAVHSTQDFSIMLMGKALKRTVQFLLASVHALTSPTYFDTQTRPKAVIQRIEARRERDRQRKACLSNYGGSERCVDCLVQILASAFELRSCSF